MSPLRSLGYCLAAAALSASAFAQRPTEGANTGMQPPAPDHTLLYVAVALVVGAVIGFVLGRATSRK